MVGLSFSLMVYMVAKGSKPSGTGQVEESNLTALISDNGNSFFQGQILKSSIIKAIRFFLQTMNQQKTRNVAMKLKLHTF